MRSIHKNRTPQQILEYWPHPVPQPDSEAARHSRMGTRFRLEFLLDADKAVHFLAAKKMNPQRRAKAQAALEQVERAQALMDEPQNAFLVADHAWHISYLLAELRRLVAVTI